jgi:hypothetical protein
LGETLGGVGGGGHESAAATCSDNDGFHGQASV